LSGIGHCDYKQPSLLCRQIMEIDWFLNTLDIRQDSHVSAPQSTYILYIEYRAVSGVFQNIDPPPLHPASVGGEGEEGKFSEDARHWIGLLEYNVFTVSTHKNILQ
jgi:hypothetical protein